MGYFARPDQIAVGATDWAMAICPPMFNYLEEYFNESYTDYMPKLGETIYNIHDHNKQTTILCMTSGGPAKSCTVYGPDSHAQ